MNRFPRDMKPSASETRLLRIRRWVMLACGLVAIGITIPEGRIVAGERDNQRWDTMVGNWYDWKAPTDMKWDAVDLAASKAGEKVTFLSRRAPVETTEHFRAVLFSPSAKTLPLPYSVGGRQRIDVYWYEAKGEEGPFLRLSDGWGEYLVDLSRQTTARLYRHKGRLLVGELRPGEDMGGGSVLVTSDRDRKGVVFIAGREAREVTGRLASEEGKNLGQIRGR